MTAMRCTYNGPFAYRGPLGQSSQCHLQVYEGDAGTAGTLPVVIATELDDNPGTSITSAAEQIASLVWRTLLPQAREGFIWYEHYPARPGRFPADETVDEVTFTPLGPCKLVAPEWRPSSRATVEALIGAAF
jgi:hypothetical protein